MVPAGQAGPLTLAPRGRLLGLYFHLPFCLRRCPYCDFNVAIYRPDRVGPFLDALGREIDLWGQVPWASSVEIRSVYFGGGTPSLLGPLQIGQFLGRLRQRFAVVRTSEVTLEANPEGLTEERLGGYLEAGVNRLSIGVQGLDDDLLGRLGRGHTANDARLAFAGARNAGFSNVNFDLIWALPGQTLVRWEATLDEVLGWRAEHISAYQLTVEPGTLFGKRGVPDLPDEETVVAQYWRLVELAGAAGYEHYEVSNFARPGFASTHNRHYWSGGEYLGLGPGAHSHLDGARFSNDRSIRRYQEATSEGRFPVAQWEVLTPSQRMAEQISLGLRTREGVPLAWLESRQGGRALEPLLSEYQAQGLLSLERGRVCLTDLGILVADTLILQLA